MSGSRIVSISSRGRVRRFAAVAIDHHRALPSSAGQVDRTSRGRRQQGSDAAASGIRVDRVAHVGPGSKEPFERPVDGSAVPGLSQPGARSLRASTMSLTPLITRSRQFDRQADFGALGGRLFPRGGRDWRNPRRGPAGLLRRGRCRCFRTPLVPRHASFADVSRGFIGPPRSARVAAFGIFLSCFRWHRPIAAIRSMMASYGGPPSRRSGFAASGAASRPARLRRHG